MARYTERDIEMITFVFEVRPELTAFERRLMNDRLAALKKFGDKSEMSPKQRAIVRKCYAKARIWPLRPFPTDEDA